MQRFFLASQHNASQYRTQSHLSHCTNFFKTPVTKRASLPCHLQFPLPLKPFTQPLASDSPFKNHAPHPLTLQWLGRIDYDEAQRKQHEVMQGIRQGKCGPHLFLLEHPPLFTIGRTQNQSSLLQREALPYPVYEINRGGQATYHGPGQLVGYLVLSLRDYGQDLHSYLRFLESCLMTLLQGYEVTAQRREGLTGVWVEDRKIASLGIGVRHWITCHGWGLNVCGQLEGFQHIVPCGLTGVTMTSVEAEIARNPVKGMQQKQGIEKLSVEAVANRVIQHFPQWLKEYQEQALVP